MLKILPSRSEEASLRKEERTCFCRHEEQYFESIEEVRLEGQETRRAAQIIARSGAVAFYNLNGPMREGGAFGQSEAPKTCERNRTPPFPP